MTLLTALLVVLAAFQAHQHRITLHALVNAHGQHVDRLAGHHQTQRMDLLDRHGRERDAWQRERSELLNRIKPETAQYVADPTLTAPALRVLATSPETGDAEWETREQMADRLLAEELNGR